MNNIQFVKICIWSLVLLSVYGSIMQAQASIGPDTIIDQIADSIASKVDIPLFSVASINTELPNSLNNEKIPVELLKAFRENRIEMSDKVSVLSEEKNSKWIISHDNMKYDVRKNEKLDRLDIYKPVYISIIDAAIGNTGLVGKTFGGYISTRLVYRLLNKQKELKIELKIMERKELEKVLNEYKIEMSDFYNPKTVKKIGRFHGVDAILTTELWKFDTYVQVEASLIRMEDATTMTSDMIPIPNESVPEGWIKEFPPEPSLQPKIDGSDGSRMVLILEGKFQMGCDEGEEDEKPLHPVYLNSFYMDETEVTNAMYAKFLNEYGKDSDDSGHGFIISGNNIEKSGNSYKPKDGHENYPVTNITWYGANTYAQFYGKRLPTEAEWEKAARGGFVGKKYPWGDVISHEDANYSGTGDRDTWLEASPVGSFPPNGYGLYDMTGNILEWCADWYNASYYSISPRRNPTGPDSGSFRVLRGGSWYSSFPDLLRVAYRYNYYNPYRTNDSIGFRCVLDPKP